MYAKYVECTDCGRKISVCNAHYLNGKPYGYNCYKKQLVLLYKQWEDEKNAEYSAKCFAAMQIFEGKRSNSFHDSICKQWNECKKLTAKQLDCIIRGFTSTETINFYLIWQQITNDTDLKSSITNWVQYEIEKNKNGFADYINNEAIINCMFFKYSYGKNGFHFYKYVFDPDFPDESIHVFISSNGGRRERKDIYLNEHMEDKEIEVLKIVKGHPEMMYVF